MVNWPGETVLSRLIDAIEKMGIGIFAPWQIKRVEGARTEARAKERLMLEQVERDVTEIREGKKRIDLATGKLIEIESSHAPLIAMNSVNDPIIDNNAPSIDMRVFAETAHSAALTREMQQSINLARTLLYAEEEAERIDKNLSENKDKQKYQKVIDDDWLNRWRIGAQSVSKGEIQRLWAKILSGEVGHPGSYSLRTIDFLANLSFKEASLIQKVSPFITYSGIIGFGEDYFKQNGISFTELLYLEDIGIISNVSNPVSIILNKEYPLSYNRNLLYLNMHHEVLFFEVPKEKPNQIRLDIMPITRTGFEILLLGDFRSNEEYLIKIADYAISRGVSEVLRASVEFDGAKPKNIRTFRRKV